MISAETEATGPVSRARWGTLGGAAAGRAEPAGSCAGALPVLPTKAAAPAAAPFKNPRRPVPLCFAMFPSSRLIGTSIKRTAPGGLAAEGDSDDQARAGRCAAQLVFLELGQRRDLGGGLRRRQRFDVRVDVGELLIGEHLGGKRRHLARARRAHVAGEGGGGHPH